MRGVGKLALPIDAGQAKDLIYAGQPAPYGKGTNTVLDPNVRKATQIEADRVCFSEGWDATLRRLVTGERALGGCCMARAVSGHGRAEHRAIADADVYGIAGSLMCWSYIDRGTRATRTRGRWTGALCVHNPNHASLCSCQSVCKQPDH